MDDTRREDELEDFGATTPNIRISDLNTARLRQPPPQQTPRQVAPPPRGRRIPIWVWLLLAGFLFVIAIGVSVGLYVYLTWEPGFTMIVRGAPPGSDVYVDNVSRGVTAADGTIRVPGLKAGKRLVRVSHEGYTDFNTSITGSGKDISIVAQLTPAETKATLPAQLDYNGPMILIANGEFIMGDDNHDPSERPAHKVTLPDFYIDKFEVTNRQYQKFCEQTHRPFPSNPWWDDNYLKASPQSPVLGVSWADANAYAAWAGKRLPSEEEWEKAASWDPATKKKRQWPWGDTPEATRANVGGQKRTSDVGQYDGGASAYGAQDMAGNVAEWVSSYFQPYNGNQSPNPDYGTQNRVVRGGTYKGDIEDARTTRRLYHAPQLNEAEKKNRAFLIGFRCAISADDPRLQPLLK
ncbi:MAG: SUMF1/EgtB/PvdO family nonheme iron enzyme [Pyrinomonadaceae bacterium]